MKKLLALSLSLAMALSLAACSSSSSTTTTTTEAATTEAATTETTTEAAEETSADPVIIGFSCDDMTTDFASALNTSILETAAAYGMEVIATDSRLDATLQTSQVENLIMQGAQAIIMKPYDDSACSPITAACQEAGVPLVVVSTTIASGSESAVLIDQTSAGAWCVEKLIEERGTDITVCVVRGPLAMANATRYYDGVMSVLEAEGVEILDIQSGEYQADAALQVTEAWLAAGLRPDVIIALNDTMGAAVAQVVGEFDLADEITVTCTGQGTAEGLNSIANGGIYSVIYSPPAVIGSVAVDTVVDLIAGNPVDEITYIPMSYANVDNINDFI